MLARSLRQGALQRTTRSSSSGVGCIGSDAAQQQLLFLRCRLRHLLARLRPPYRPSGGCTHTRRLRFLRMLCSFVLLATTLAAATREDALHPPPDFLSTANGNAFRATGLSVGTDQVCEGTYLPQCVRQVSWGVAESSEQGAPVQDARDRPRVQHGLRAGRERLLVSGGSGLEMHLSCTRWNTTPLGLGLFRKSNRPSRRGGLDLGLFRKSNRPSWRGGWTLDFSASQIDPQNAWKTHMVRNACKS